MDVHIRGMDPDLWQALRVEAVQRRLTMAELIEALWREHQQRQQEASRG